MKIQQRYILSRETTSETPQIAIGSYSMFAGMEEYIYLLSRNASCAKQGSNLSSSLTNTKFYNDNIEVVKAFLLKEFVKTLLSVQTHLIL